MENKKQFTQQYLEPLAKQVNDHVLSLDYVIATPSNEEYVIITYQNFYKKRVCVSCDSYRAMTIDVIKVV